jgi:hypothetical protein
VRGLLVQIDKEPAQFRPPDGVERIGDAADGALPEGFASALAGIRTDLDRFLPEEAELLMYHGYWSTHMRLRHLWPDLAVADPNWTTYAALPSRQEVQLLSLINAGERRSLNRR